MLVLLNIDIFLPTGVEKTPGTQAPRDHRVVVVLRARVCKPI